MKRKKLQDVRITTGPGVSYMLKIEAGCVGGSDVFNEFYITLPFGDEVSAGTATEVTELAKQKLVESGEAKPVKLIGVSIEGDNTSFFSLSIHNSATFTLLWDVGYCLALRDGRKIHFKEDGKTRNHGWHWDRELPWSQAAEDALASATKQLHAARKKLQDMVMSNGFQARLESSGLLALPAPDNEKERK